MDVGGGLKVKHLVDALEAGGNVSNVLVKAKVESWDEREFMVYEGCPACSKKLNPEDITCPKYGKKVTMRKNFYRLVLLVGDETASVWAIAWDAVGRDFLRIEPDEFTALKMQKQESTILEHLVGREFVCRFSITRGRSLRIDRADAVGKRVLFPNLSPEHCRSLFGSNSDVMQSSTTSGRKMSTASRSSMLPIPAVVEHLPTSEDIDKTEQLPPKNEHEERDGVIAKRRLQKNNVETILLLMEKILLVQLLLIASFFTVLLMAVVMQ